MIKDVMDDNAGVTPNSREMGVLKTHFPGYFQTDGSFDLARFSSEVLQANGASVTQEGFGLDFLGKNYAKLIASLDTETVIVPDEAHNSLPENKESRNVYITGDNLDALKHLLKSYSGKVKCIYIDPPYNTGSDDFVYNDTFNFSAGDIERKLGIDEEQAKKLLSFTSEGSSSHSAWLTFMYPRLQLAKGLLSDDGVIFISIDDNEAAQIKLLCDSIFGEENFVANFIWVSKTGGGSDSNTVVTDQEYVLCYTRDGKSFSALSKILMAAEPLDKEDKYGKYRLGRELNKWGSNSRREDRPTMFFPISGPTGQEVYPIRNDGKEGCWRWGKIKMEEAVCKHNVEFLPRANGTFVVYEKIRHEEPRMKPYRTVLDECETTAEGSKQVKNLFDEVKIFDFPKPLGLISLLIKVGISDDEDLILDFFSGSATTAHAVMKVNAEDDGNRQYIMVQLPEIVKENSEAFKAGYKTIDEIGQERIKRAAKKIREENPLFAGDLGFKHYTLKEVSQDTLDKLEIFDPEGTVDDATVLDTFGRDTVLETWLVRDGYGFAADVQAVKLKDTTAYWCGRHLYLIDPGFTQDDVAALFKKYDMEGAFSTDHVVLFGYSFVAWSVREMLEINLRQLKDGAKNLQINIDCARKFFEQMKIEGYRVEFRTQLNNKKMKQIIVEVLGNKC